MESRWGRDEARLREVSWHIVLGITNIDPIRYQLLFERFLNPERVSMPDIDVDFCLKDGRKLSIMYKKIWKRLGGSDRYLRYTGSRGVIRDVGRVMDLPYAFVDSIAKMIPQEPNITIDKALKASNDLRKLYENDEQVKQLIDMSKRLEGLPRHSSMHAAGVVIGQKGSG